MTIKVYLIVKQLRKHNITLERLVMDLSPNYDCHCTLWVSLWSGFVSGTVTLKLSAVTSVSRRFGVLDYSMNAKK